MMISIATLSGIILSRVTYEAEERHPEV